MRAGLYTESKEKQGLLTVGQSGSRLLSRNFVATQTVQYQGTFPYY